MTTIDLVIVFAVMKLCGLIALSWYGVFAPIPVVFAMGVVVAAVRALWGKP